MNSLSLCLISVWRLTFSIRWLLMVSISLLNFFTFSCFLDHLKQTYYSLYLRIELSGLRVIVFLLTLAFFIMLSFLSGYFSSNLQKNCNSSPKNFPLTCCRHDAPWLPGILGCISCTLGAFSSSAKCSHHTQGINIHLPLQYGLHSSFIGMIHDYSLHLVALPL